jgi:hypothetical protein
MMETEDLSCFQGHAGSDFRARLQQGFGHCELVTVEPADRAAA